MLSLNLDSRVRGPLLGAGIAYTPAVGGMVFSGLEDAWLKKKLADNQAAFGG